MSRLAKLGFRYRDWTLTDANKKIFVAGAALDTYVERLLTKLDDHVISGGDLAQGVKNVFDAFRWFVSVADTIPKMCGGHHHFNYVLLAEILTWKLEHDFLISVLVHYDGTIESTG